MKLLQLILGKPRQLEGNEAAAFQEALAGLRFSMKRLLSLKLSPADFLIVDRMSAAFEEMAHALTVLEKVGPEDVRVSVDRKQLLQAAGVLNDCLFKLREATSDLQVRLAAAEIVDSLFVLAQVS